MLDFVLVAVTDSPSTYLVLFAIVLIDDFVWFAPGDTAMITAGIIAANGELMLTLVIVAGAIGGMLGDNVFYFLGRRFGPGLADRLFKRDRARERYRWAKEQIGIRGSTIIIVGRFIPAGRTVTTSRAGHPSCPTGASCSPTRLPPSLGRRIPLSTRVHRRKHLPRRAVAAAAHRTRGRAGARGRRRGLGASPRRRRQC